MANTSFRLFAPLVCCSILLSGCTRWTYDIGRNLSPEEVPAVEDQLAVGDVLARLGPPLRLSALPGGYVLAYEHWHIVEDKVGLSLSAAGADFLSIDWGSAHTQGEFLLLSFNREHQLVDSTFEEWDRDVGGGKGIQPLLSVVSVVDVGDLTNPMPQHRWGAFSLEELPVTLNADNHLDSGQSGLEQRGTPVNIGQRSLEMP
ncbi:MAG: hypothetical protein O7F73_14150 [Gammaproteobacteria bacterium]|nr:hypothetical protein [Gammaproteobacteria bacterium]